jgi:hypothetical protein
METTVLFVIAYLATGIALIGYDFTATHKKKYILEGELRGALTAWFFWPMDSYYAIKKGKGGIRFALSVMLLFITIFFIASLFLYFVASSSVFAYLGCFVIVVLLSPFLAALALPNHDEL